MGAPRQNTVRLRLAPPKPPKPQATKRQAKPRPARRKRQPAPQPDIATTPKLLLSVQEAAYALGCGRTKLYALLDAGEIPSFKVGPLRRVPLAALERYVERMQCAQGGQAPHPASSLQA